MNYRLKQNSDTRIFAPFGERPQLIGHRAKIDGKRSLAYTKNGKLLAYVTFEELCKEILLEGPCLEYSTEMKLQDPA